MPTVLGEHFAATWLLVKPSSVSLKEEISVAVPETCVVGGVGVSILSALAVEQEVASGTLLAFEMDRSALKRDIYLITLRGRSFTRTEQKFIDFLKSCKRKRKHDAAPQN